MSNLLAYGDKVVGVVARDEGSVSVTADGIKSYGTLFNELFSLVDSNKVDVKSMLKIDATVFTMVYQSPVQLCFSASYGNSNGVYIQYAVFRTASTLMIITANARTDVGANVPPANTVIKIIY